MLFVIGEMNFSHKSHTEVAQSHPRRVQGYARQIQIYPRTGYSYHQVLYKIVESI